MARCYFDTNPLKDCYSYDPKDSADFISVLTNAFLVMEVHNEFRFPDTKKKCIVYIDSVKKEPDGCCVWVFKEIQVQ